ncbi:zf-HC2 domain-containing protein [Pseudonocardia parietis]|uniref:Putative zinc-finger domain-containing protein n=1 Tax=Pseudonocardia parietis TaxID=570936 RepID=A0ABS4W4Y2_9PSEU|nr:zf-HC2 domain-containing protein [Pseudonocardia parietis]MBP2371287.1 hypothetical protein [Pseudonocardia parietis]
MTPDEHRTMRESLGDYAIGRLPDGEAAAVRAHLDGCAACRAELAKVSSVLPALGGVDPEHLDRTPVPPADLGERIVAAARAERRPAPRRRLPTSVAAAAAAVALVVGGVAGYAVGDYDGIPREPVAVQASAPEIRASAVAIPHTWGMEIVLDADGFRPGATYRVVVEATDGREVDAGAFIGTGAAPMVCNLNSSVLRPDASGFKVLDTAGSTVLRGDLTPA